MLFIFLTHVSNFVLIGCYLLFNLYLFHWKTIYIDSFPHFPVFGCTKKNQLMENYLQSMEKPNKNKAYFLWDVFQIFFLENNLSLTHHVFYKYYIFLYPMQPPETTYFGTYSVSQSHGKLSIFSFLFALSLLSYSHYLSPSGLSSFQFSQISLYLFLTVNNSSLHW